MDPKELAVELEEKRRQRDELDKEINRLFCQLERIRDDCTHNFGETKYDPIITPNYFSLGYEGYGSDSRPIIQRSGDNTKERWTRTCKLCGKIEHTEKQKTVKTEPDFG